MRTTITQWVFIAASLLSVVFWNSAMNYQLALNVALGAVAAIVVAQVLQANKYRWAAVKSMAVSSTAERQVSSLVGPNL